MLMPDLILDFGKKIHTIHGLTVDERHILFAHGAKATRISHSTSHSKTIAAMSGLETAPWRSCCVKPSSLRCNNLLLSKNVVFRFCQWMR